MEKNFGTGGALAFARKLSVGKLASKAYAILGFQPQFAVQIKKSEDNSDRKPKHFS
ncbi:MAG: hypothetical protein K6T94_25290 [Paenibacillus sp.]|nr:hypothetical protein [Paenibacillus sp.]